ncbi:hypothetical protein FCI23_37440 [Actinacidiphila oryziradicis]|uniref:Tyr recombinase domain-containing protein n=1 Tax=Actinacidiphila oryziradicis TaxID=2571141 RepID=A0A4U0S2I2_9ACTN|nr:tyrosine-type recombinase/integrase [Actinacidiphila oryziradicis]TKA03042.1 hypothetical protein FCI23_37440 [Actinacidiphila oryziradicis]
MRPGSLTLSALGDAVRQRRLAHNPARPSVLPRPPAAERRIWTPEQAARFLRHCHRADPFMADLCEVLIGTGMRKGEALGLHWKDVHLPEQVLYVRYTLSAIDNNRVVLTSPKTRSSKNWVALSPRVTAALQHQALAAGQPLDPAGRADDVSAAPMVGRCGPSGCWTASATCPKRQACRASRCTSCGTSPPPSRSPSASR